MEEEIDQLVDLVSNNMSSDFEFVQIVGLYSAETNSVQLNAQYQTSIGHFDYLRYLFGDDLSKVNNSVVKTLNIGIRELFLKYFQSDNKLRLVVFSDGKYKLETKYDEVLAWFKKIKHSDPELDKISPREVADICSWEGLEIDIPKG